MQLEPAYLNPVLPTYLNPMRPTYLNPVLREHNYTVSGHPDVRSAPCVVLYCCVALGQERQIKLWILNGCMGVHTFASHPLIGELNSLVPANLLVPVPICRRSLTEHFQEPSLVNVEALSSGLTHHARQARCPCSVAGGVYHGSGWLVWRSDHWIGYGNNGKVGVKQLFGRVTRCMREENL